MSEFFDFPAESRKRIGIKIRIRPFLCAERFEGGMSVIMSGIHDQGVRQGMQNLAHGVKHEIRIAVTAAVDEQRVPGENRGIVSQTVADAAVIVPGCKKTFDPGAEKAEGNRRL